MIALGSEANDINYTATQTPYWGRFGVIDVIGLESEANDINYTATQTPYWGGFSVSAMW
jgi:hypothetical protein